MLTSCELWDVVLMMNCAVELLEVEGDGERDGGGSDGGGSDGVGNNGLGDTTAEGAGGDAMPLYLPMALFGKFENGGV